MASWNPISATIETLTNAVEKYFPDEITKEKAKAEIFAQTANLQLQHDKMQQEHDAAILADVGSARTMQTALKSKMPVILSCASLAMFIFILFWAIAGDKIGWTMPETGTRHDIIMISITLIIREVTAVFAFWMGSSDGSKSKDLVLGKLSE